MTDTVLPFQRARKPEEQQVRREAILAAAAELFDAEGPQGAGLNAIAAKAGFTKSNLYRYFESREDVLLSLFLDEIEKFVVEIEERLGALDGGIKKIARVSAQTFEEHPRLGALISILTTVLEQNVSEETVDRPQARDGRARHADRRGHSRRSSRRQNSRTASGSRACSARSSPACGRPPTPAPSPPTSLRGPSSQHLKPTIERDLERVARALLKSIVD